MQRTISIPQPPWSGLGKKLESQVRRAIFDFNLLENTTKLAVALSGGKDSLSLLYLLKAISGRGVPSFDIVAIHVAGEFTCGAGVNGNYLKTVCDALEIPLIIRESTKTLENLECYSCSRERRSLLFKAAKEAGCESIAFGHHSDDNAQTLLLNLCHKGEFAGLLPKIHMVEYDITIIRPLIHIREEQIIDFAKSYGFARITCKCPVGQTSKRKVVDTFLTEMETHFPHVRTNLATASLLYGSQKANDVIRHTSSSRTSSIKSLGSESTTC